MLVAITLVSVFAIPVLASVGYSMECTIYYKDESGNTLSTAKKFTINAAGDNAGSVGYASPFVSGYSLKNSGDTFVSYSMMSKNFPASNYVRHGTATYTVYYVKNQSTTIYYKYSNGNTAASSTTVSGDPNATFSVTSPTVTGYTPSKTTCTGKYGSASQTVYYYEKTYTVSYDANGGSGAPASQTKTYGQPLTLSSKVPPRSGYEFVGWATTSSATSASYPNAPGANFVPGALLLFWIFARRLS